MLFRTQGYMQKGKMTMNFKQRLLRGEHAFGTMITAFDTPEMVRILKDCGLWLILSACMPKRDAQ